MIVALCGLAMADPIALRAPAGAVAVVLAVPDSSIGVAVAPHLGVSVDVHGWSAIGASVGYRADLYRAEGGFGVGFTVAGGPMVPVIDPGLALSATPSMAVGWVNRSLDATVGLTVPAVLRIAPGADLRLPVLGELWLGGSAGPVRLGVTFAAGQMWITGAPAQVGWHGGIYVVVRPAAG